MDEIIGRIRVSGILIVDQKARFLDICLGPFTVFSPIYAVKFSVWCNESVWLAFFRFIIRQPFDVLFQRALFTELKIRGACQFVSLDFACD